jgi:uncharacterized protein YuzE
MEALLKLLSEQRVEEEEEEEVVVVEEEEEGVVVAMACEGEEGACAALPAISGLQTLWCRGRRR